MVPVFFALVAVAVAALLREGRVLRRHLAPEVAAGHLTREELDELSSLRERRRALRAARRHGRAAIRTQKELQRTATELAFLRRRAARDPTGEGHLGAEERDYAARLRALSSARTPLGPAGGLPTSTPPAAWYPDPYRQARLRWWDGSRWTEHLAP